jgi:prevent-host-death family protein
MDKVDKYGGSMQVTSTEFQQNIGRYQDAAQQAPVVITKNARPHTVLMSAAFFKLVMEGRIARRIEELDEDTLKAIARSAVPAEYAALDNLLKDWTP